MPLDPPPAPPNQLSPPQSLVQASDTPSPLPDLIEKYYPAAQVHIFSGASGAGKTALLSQLLTALHRGEPWLGKWPTRKPAYVGIIVTDRRWSDHEQWFTKAGYPEIPHYSLVDDPDFDASRFRGKNPSDRFLLFNEAVYRLCGGIPARDSVIAVDVLAPYLGGNLNDYNTVYSHMIEFNRYTRENQCTIFGVVHAGKQKSDPGQRYTRPQDRILGSTAQTACAGTTFHLSPPEETSADPKAEKVWSTLSMVPHHTVAVDLRLKRDDVGLFVPDATELVEVYDYQVLDLIPFEEPGIDSLELRTLLPDVTKPTFYRRINQFRAAGLIREVKKGRTTFYKRVVQEPHKSS